MSPSATHGEFCHPAMGLQGPPAGYAAKRCCFPHTGGKKDAVLRHLVPPVQLVLENVAIAGALWVESVRTVALPRPPQSPHQC